jgi:hypothetical protein
VTTVRRLLGLVVTIAIGACGGRSLAVPEPVAARAGCYVLGPAAMGAPFRFPDTLELAAEWFLPTDSAGGRLRVVKPRDASLDTYRAFGGRFWWESAGDSIIVTRSDGAAGTVLALSAAADGFPGVIRTFGVDPRLMEYVDGRRVPCGGQP